MIFISAIATLFLISSSWKDVEIQSCPKEMINMVSPLQNDNEDEHEFELAIDLELARFEGRSLRPYVAVWVENEKAEPVRTLALWFNNYKWLPDLKRWYSKNFEKTQEAEYIDAITGATRPAGKYTIIWDAKDDKGNLQGSGKYTVYIEVVRERGTYQLIRQPFELNDKPQRFDLPAGTEVSSVTIEYRKADKINIALN
ncbi:MAG TPA: DUF2271 domain-containing protein [Bacteroidales bacterium]|nr:DUF2271 domain-containing protein [Bacteroidales bacterium]